ncbi:MAG: AAA family ATPase [bacterium]|nr:AAA family ATPase [bacterium]
MKKERIILGLAGKMASGKSTLARMLAENMGFKVLAFSEPVTFLCERLGFLPTRENLDKIAFAGLEYDKHFWDWIILGKLRETRAEKVVIDGVRSPGTARLLKKLGAKIVLLKVSPEVAYRRSQQRGAEKDRVSSFAEFLQLFNHPTEKGVDEIERKGLFDLLLDTDNLGIEQVFVLVKAFVEALQSSSRSAQLRA